MEEASRAVVALMVVLAILAIAGEAVLSSDGYCDASTAECGSVYGSSGFMEDGTDVEMQRRMLLAPLSVRYISYGALSKDRVPCSRAGYSYYNCRGSGPANSYHRGCNRITHCPRDVS